MKKDNPFFIHRLSKTAPPKILSEIEELENPLTRALYALETPYLLPRNFEKPIPTGLFESLLEGNPLVNIPHCRALVAFFINDFKTAKTILESAPVDPYTTFNLILCLEALGERETPQRYWQDKLQEDLRDVERIAIYEHLRTYFAAHESVQNDLKVHFMTTQPEIMKLYLSHLVLHKDFDLAEELWVSAAIEYEELEDFGVDLALAEGKLSLAMARLRSLTKPQAKEAYVEDFIKVVALKALEDKDTHSALEMIEILLLEFELSEKELLFYLRLKCNCSLLILKQDLDLNALPPDSKQNLKTGLTQVKTELEKELPRIKALAHKLNEPVNGIEDDYLSYLEQLLVLLQS